MMCLLGRNTLPSRGRTTISRPETHCGRVLLQHDLVQCEKAICVICDFLLFTNLRFVVQYLISIGVCRLNEFIGLGRRVGNCDRVCGFK